jgi:flavin prenyltransferase
MRVLPIVIAITGASGAPYAVRLLEALLAAERPVWLIVSSHGFRLLQTEMAIPDLPALRAHVGARAVSIVG